MVVPTKKSKRSVVKGNNTKIALAVVLVGVAVVFGAFYLIRDRADKQAVIMVPDLSTEAKSGQAAFQAHCISCHGENAAGTEKGPPLVNDIYRPAHHADYSFVRAVTLGVPQHHWLFGAMPAQPQVPRQEIDRIIIYIRELQTANGIK